MTENKVTAETLRKMVEVTEMADRLDTSINSACDVRNKLTGEFWNLAQTLERGALYRLDGVLYRFDGFRLLVETERVLDDGGWQKIATANPMERLHLWAPPQGVLAAEQRICRPVDWRHATHWRPLAKDPVR